MPVSAVYDYDAIAQRVKFETNFIPPPTTILPPYEDNWPPDYQQVYRWRLAQLRKLTPYPNDGAELRKEKKERLAGAIEFYKWHPVDFINHWVDTQDTRNAGKVGKLVNMPMILFERQAHLVQFIYECLEAEQGGLIEKARDMGATWTCCACSVHIWRFFEGDVGWGSRHADLVDRIGVMDSIFEKLRFIVRRLPKIFLPKGFNEECLLAKRILTHPGGGASITGEVGDNIGRGGRKRIYFWDEAAHSEHPELIQSALMSNTRCQIDLSSVNGLGNVFHRKREAGIEWFP